jgi:pimeloyl-ACP methyl ester carboxylesterase
MSTYVDIDGHPTWLVDSGGDGDLVLMLHGGLSSSEVMHENFGSALTRRYRVAAFDRRGHGRTADGPGPFGYAAMAAETIAVLAALDGKRSCLLGYSDGANVAIHVALARPDLVSSLVLVGANYHHSGMVAGFTDVDVDHLAAGHVGAAYGDLSPDGAAHFQVVAAKSVEMWKHGPTLTEGDLRRVAQPVLVMVGDDDAITLAHTCALFEAFPAGQLAVVPGTSHLLAYEKPDLMNQLIAEFLDDPRVPTTLWPQRRRKPAR